MAAKRANIARGRSPKTRTSARTVPAIRTLRVWAIHYSERNYSSMHQSQPLTGGWLPVDWTAYLVHPDICRQFQYPFGDDVA
jgi:hypothetical protein